MELSTFAILAAIFVATLLGALPPLARRWSDRGLHLFIAVSAGIFLGTVFLHLLPELAHVAAADEGHGESGPWLAALGGFLGLFLLEKVWLRGTDERGGVDPHEVVWLPAYIGLCVHAFTAGLGLSALDIKALVLLPILWHKITESFSLTSVLQLSGASRSRFWLLVGSFSLVTPLGFLFGEHLLIGEQGQAKLLMGLACGTFLYIAACDLLPEVFHHLEKRTPRLVALLLGIASTALFPHELEAAGEPLLVVDWALGSWSVLLAMAPYLLFGFVIAGLLSEWLAPSWLSRFLAGDTARSVGIASVLGAPLPLCSCSVLPVAASLRRGGASKGATSAFLVATPETGVDSVAVTWGLMDPVLTIARPVASVLSAVFCGLGVNRLVKSGHDDDPQAGRGGEASTDSCAGSEDSSKGAAPVSKPGHWLSRAMRFAFVDMFDDLAGALLLGLVLSGLISALVPPDALSEGLLGGHSGLLVMLAIGIPVYVCASASTPIAASLILKGLSPGAALVFLLAGPATNLATLTVMATYLGKRTVVLHIALLALVTLICGLALNAIYAALRIAPSARLAEEHSMAPGPLELACTVVLVGCLAATWWRRAKNSNSSAPGHSHI